MASYRCGVVLVAGLLLMGTGLARAQQSSTGPLTYDQMLAQEKQAKTQQDAQAAKHEKKKHDDADAAATPAAPAAAESTATPAAAESPATPAAAPGSDAAATPALATAPDAASGATVQPSSVPPSPTATAAAQPTVKSAKEEAKDESKDDAKFKPVKLGHLKSGNDKEKGKKKKKEKAPKLVPVNIVHGELTVDGMIAKAGLNFQILDLKYIYIWVPGLGTAIVSNDPFPGATIQGGALDGNTLTVTVDGHTLQLACDRPMLVTKDEKHEEDREQRAEMKQKTLKPQKRDKKDKPMAMFVAIDRNWQKPSTHPELGYGDLQKAPYSWPGTLADLNPNTKAPPLPDDLKQHPEKVKLCGKNGDASSCREVAVPLVLGKDS